MIHGALMARDRKRFASGSLMNSAFTGSNVMFRFNHMQMLAACTVDIDRYMTSAFATARRRDLIQLKKLRP